MAAAVYTISSSPPIRHPHGTFRGTRLGQGTGAPTSRPAPAPTQASVQPVPFAERLRHAATAARGRPVAGRGITVRRAGFPRKI
ncbi:hypothetical protein DI458_15450 [Burkholderia contaminans]|nr:hypothetical protein [Burkholderia contaminans]MBA9840327.1 hypothetical protein [Burkholderia contaminans]MBA9864211.1 hypothetical protein [Burkholderia contaminans]MBA9907319.1 hypothetical protein [Burkholderia contaminans]MBA9932889.1 hypothetical protein [Burkholderia contaminans]